jgi:hypothetical protein
VKDAGVGLPEVLQVADVQDLPVLHNAGCRGGRPRQRLCRPCTQAHSSEKWCDERGCDFISHFRPGDCLWSDF